MYHSLFCSPIFLFCLPKNKAKMIVLVNDHHIYSISYFSVLEQPQSQFEIDNVLIKAILEQGMLLS